MPVFMSIERSYYENPDFWTPAAFMSEEAERLGYIASKIPPDATSLLDVGCGNGLFLKQVRAARPNLHLHGAERSKAALEWVECDKTETSIDALPFADRSYDVVSCLEVIEHLPVEIYRSGLAELARVAGRVLMISVPADQDLTLGRVECPSCRTIFNPDFHWRSYDKQAMVNLMTDYGWRPVEVAPYGDAVEYAGSKMITRIKNDTSNRYPQSIPCPGCGHVIPGRGEMAQMQVTSTISRGGGVKGAIKALWPKVTSQRWILGIYQRI